MRTVAAGERSGGQACGAAHAAGRPARSGLQFTTLTAEQQAALADNPHYLATALQPTACQRSGMVRTPRQSRSRETREA